MSTQQTTMWQHSNPDSAQAACQHCQGVTGHQSWCITRSELVLYAYEAALDADKLAEGDRLILHALGVAWINSGCTGTCLSAERRPN